MPVFTAGAAAIATAIGFTAGTTGFIIAQSLIAAGLAAGAGHLLGVFDEGGLPPVEDPGVEQRLGASTQNRVPILYGQFMQRGSLTYAEITEDRKTLYTVITLGEGPVTSIDSIYWDDILLTLDANGEVTAGVDVEGNAVTRLNGQLNVQTYLGTATGNNSTYLEGLVTDWTSNHKMTNLVYAVVTVRYNRDNDVTNLSDMRFIGTAPINSPAEAVIDQLTNVRHGLGLSPTVIDSDSFNDALVYYQTMLPYTDAAGNTQMAERFQVNGSLNSADPVFERIEAILLGSNSSLRWQGGKYSIFINKADTVEAFNMNESRVVGDIQVSEVGLNSVVNSVEVQYGRDPNNNYQRNTVTVDLPTANRYPNELDRVRSIDLPLARTFVEAERIAYILLNQSREQLSIKHTATVEAMPLEAGDVITYTLPNYGWDEKQFRITRVSEMETEDGLQYEIEAVEYAASVYTDRTHVEPGASPNTNIPALDIVAPVTDLALVSQSPNAGTPNFTLQWSVPDNALIDSFDIFANAGAGVFNSSSTFLVRTVSTVGTYTSNAVVTEVVTGLSNGTYTLWVVGRNSLAASSESNPVTLSWQPSSAITDLTTVYRFHENVVTNDPGAPTGADGTGGGWVENSDNPHWEAVTSVLGEGGESRILNFTTSGTAGEVSVAVPGMMEAGYIDVASTVSTPSGLGTLPSQPEQFRINAELTVGNELVRGNFATFPSMLTAGRIRWFEVEFDTTGISKPNTASFLGLSLGFITNMGLVEIGPIGGFSLTLESTTLNSIIVNDFNAELGVSTKTDPFSNISTGYLTQAAFNSSYDTELGITTTASGIPPFIFRPFGFAATTEDTTSLTDRRMKWQCYLDFSVGAAYDYSEIEIQEAVIIATTTTDPIIFRSTTTVGGNTDTLPSVNLEISELSIDETIDIGPLFLNETRTTYLGAQYGFITRFASIVDNFNTFPAFGPQPNMYLQGIVNQNLTVDVTVDQGTTGATFTANLEVLQQGSDGTDSAYDDLVLRIEYASDRPQTESILNIAEDMNAQQITQLIADAINGTTTYSASVDDADDLRINFMSLIAGAGNDIEVEVTTAGSSSVVTANFVTTITTQGTDDTVTGDLTAYSILLGGAEVANGMFVSAASAGQMATTLLSALSTVADYVGESVSVGTFSATSTFKGSAPDLDISITGGTGSTAALMKNIVSIGLPDATDLSGAVWQYFVINQEVRVDDDTVDMGADNTIAVRRGLILDSTSIQGGSYTTAVGTPIVIPTTHTVGNKPATLVVTGGATLGAQASAGGSTVGFTVEYSVDGGTTWLAGQSSDLLQIGAGAGLNGQLLLPTLGGNFAADVAAGVTVSFRITKTGTDTNMLILSQFLILEELRAV